MRRIGTVALLALLAGCGGSTTVVAQGDGGKPAIASNDRPTGEWRTSSIKQAPSTSVPGAKPDAFNLRFFDDGRVIAQARCNSISGAYRIDDGRFRMDEAAQTEMGCPGENRHEEDQWLSAFLTSGPAWSFDGKVIGLDGTDIDVELKPREEVQPNKPLANTHWRLTHVTNGPALDAPSDPNAAVSAGMPRGQVDMQLYDDLVRIKFDCTTLHGPAEINGTTIRFGTLKPTSPNATCSQEQQASVDEVHAVLEGEVVAKTSPFSLTLTHPSGRGLQFEVGPEQASGPAAS